MDQQEIQEIKITIEEAKEAIENKDMAVKLLSSKEFKHVIGHLYFEMESVRLVGLLSEEGLDDKQMAGVHRQMFGISNLQRFMRELVGLGNQMEADLSDATKELDRPEAN